MNKNIVWLVAMAVCFASCKKFGDLNIDPTKSSSLNPEFQLAYAQQKFSGDLGTQERVNTILTMPMVQHGGGTWSCQYGQFYVRQESYRTSVWQDGYLNEIKNIIDAEERTHSDAARKNLNAMCRVMKVYLFARITDLFGDIPYSQASAAYSQGISTPAYDKQEDIYNDFFKQLDTAKTHFETGTDQVSNDAFYQGDVSKWKKFTASLRLRLALRLVKRNEAKAKEEVLKAYNDGLMTSNDDICMLKHDDVQSSYSDYRGNGVSIAISSGDVIYYKIANAFIDKLKSTNDPRLYVIARNYLDNPYKPFEREDITDQVKAQVGSFGVGPDEFIWDNWQNTIYINTATATDVPVSNYEQKIQIANPLIKNNAPFLHLTYGEVELLLADASVRLGLSLGVSANEHYKKGIRAACQQLSLFPGSTPVSDAAIIQFINTNPLQAGRELELINTQLWIAYFLNGPEAYANLRRSGYPVLSSGYKPGYSQSEIMPRRFEYPALEKALNRVHVDEAVHNMGEQEDSWNNRVWWDME